jgi:4-amino-4-deoxy-L-arabinose transferase-like glycosyltransferase
MNTGVDEGFSVIQIIQLILAPAVMINACGLLLLATSNKYSTVLNRIRLLSDEKRKLFRKAGEKNFEETQRLESLARQIEHLMVRAKHVRNSVMCYTGAIALFIVTSLLIGVSFLIRGFESDSAVMIAFLIGLLVVFAGVVFSLVDAKRGYEIVRFDVQVDE